MLMVSKGLIRIRALPQKTQMTGRDRTPVRVGLSARALVAELEAWDDPDARRWSARFGPVSQTLTRNFLRWLPTATYPMRRACTPAGRSGISRPLSYADLRPDGELSQALRGAGSRWFGADGDYPGGWEPSFQDFVSPALCEAELLTRLLPREDYPDWLGRFLPGSPVASPPPCSPPPGGHRISWRVQVLPSGSAKSAKLA